MDSIHGYAFYFAYFVTHVFDFFLVFVYVFLMENAVASSSAPAQPAETATQSNNGIQRTMAQTLTMTTESSTPASEHQYGEREILARQPFRGQIGP